MIDTEENKVAVSEDGGIYGHELPIKDLLDRFEILYRDNENLSLLRRIYNDRDLSSIFKLTEDEELRKAVMENNLHSLFRLLENYQCLISDHEELRKAVVEQNLRSIFRVLESQVCLVGDHEDLRKAVVEQNLHSLFRVLDNFQINPTIELDDLRKAITEKQLHSIFRLYDDVDDLRKAVIDKNLYSIFRLYDDVGDLRKAVVDKNLSSIFNLLDLIEHKKLILDDNRFCLHRILESYVPESSLLKALKFIEQQQIPFQHDCLSRGQLKSKQWIIDNLTALDIDLGCVFLCAGWYATLSAMMLESGLKISKIRSFDIDPSCERLAETFNRQWVVDDWIFKSVTKDIMDINYKIEEYTVKKHDGSTETLWDVPDTVINTSCEHIDRFSEWYSKIPEGVLLILQTNNYTDIEDHVNCSHSLEDFTEQTPMQECLYEGELDLGQYKRFMRIGYK